MDVQQILALFDREQRQQVTYSDTRREASGEVVRLVSLDEPTIVIVYSDLDEGNADAVIERELAYAAGLGTKVNWKLYTHDRPTDLGGRLVAHGLQPDELEAVLVLDLSSAPPELRRPVPATGDAFTIRRITTSAEIGDAIAVETEVWQSDHNWMRSLGRELDAEPERLSMYCAYVDGRPASAAWIRFHPGSQFASLWGGSTLAKYRRRGLYTALLALRAQEALARGVRYLTIDASPMSRPIVERHGFQLITHAQDHKQESTTTAASPAPQSAPAGS